MTDLPTDLPLLSLPEADVRPLLRAIQECLDDDLPRRALADWLEEHGDARAELIRAGLGGDLKRLRRWWEVYGERWVGALPEGARVEVPCGLMTLVWPATLFSEPPEVVPEKLRSAIEEGWLFRLVLEGQLNAQPAGAPGAGDVLLDHVTVVRWPHAGTATLDLLRHRPRLRALDLSESEVDGALVEREGWPALERLDLRGCERLTSVTLDGLPLQSLRLGWCPALQRVNIANLSDLTVLSLGMCGELRELSLREVPKLREVSLRGCPWVTDTFLASLAPAEALEAIDLARCGRVEGPGLRYLAEMRGLRRLDLSECANLSAVAIAEWPALQSLEVAGSAVGSLDLADLPALDRLNLACCGGITAVGLRGLPRLPSLPTGDMRQLARLDAHDLPEVTSLDLSGLRSLRGVSLQGLHSLRRLDLSGCGQLDQLTLEGLDSLQALTLRRCGHLPSQALSQLGSLPALRDLDLGQCRRLERLALAGLGRLERLVVDECPNLRSVGLTNLPALRELHLSLAALTAGAALPVIAGLPGLVALHVWTASGAQDWGRWPESLERLTIKGAVQHLRLTNVPRVRQFDLRACYELIELELLGPAPVRALDLSGLGQLRSVRLEGLAHLRDLTLSNCRALRALELPGTTGLRRVRLDGCASLPADAAGALESQANLREVHLTGARYLGQAVVLRLRERFPRCSVRR